ncbi:MAG: hypothetical protein ACTSRB_13680, partial [Candidatus Helarchaeota archaeon]
SDVFIIVENTAMAWLINCSADNVLVQQGGVCTFNDSTIKTSGASGYLQVTDNSSLTCTNGTNIEHLGLFEITGDAFFHCINTSFDDFMTQPVVRDNAVVYLENVTFNEFTTGFCAFNEANVTLYETKINNVNIWENFFYNDSSFVLDSCGEVKTQSSKFENWGNASMSFYNNSFGISFRSFSYDNATLSILRDTFKYGGNINLHENNEVIIDELNSTASQVNVYMNGIYDMNSNITVLNSTLYLNLALEKNLSITIENTTFTRLDLPSYLSDANRKITITNSTQMDGNIYLDGPMTFLNVSRNSKINYICAKNNATMEIKESQISFMDLFNFSSGTLYNATIGGDFKRLRLYDNSSLYLNNSNTPNSFQLELFGDSKMVFDGFNGTSFTCDARENSSLYFLNSTLSNLKDGYICAGVWYDETGTEANLFYVNSTIICSTLYSYSRLSIENCNDEGVEAGSIYVYGNHDSKFNMNNSTTSLEIGIYHNASATIQNSEFKNIKPNTYSNNQNVTIFISDSFVTDMIDSYGNVNLTVLRSNVTESIYLRLNTTAEIHDVYGISYMTIRDNTNFNITNVHMTSTGDSTSLTFGSSSSTEYVSGSVKNVYNITNLNLYSFSNLDLENLNISNLRLGQSWVWLNGSDSLFYTNDTNLGLSSIKMQELSWSELEIERGASFWLHDYFSNNITLRIADDDTTVIVQNCTFPTIDFSNGNNIFVLENSTITSGFTINIGSSVNFTAINSTFYGQEMFLANYLVPNEIQDTIIKGFLWILSGDVRLYNCSIANGGYIWANNEFLTLPPMTVNLQITDSTCEDLRVNSEANVSSENSYFKASSIFDNSTVSFLLCNLTALQASDTAHLTLNWCRVESHDFTTSNLNIENSNILDSAPILEGLPSLITNPSDFLLNWTVNPGLNFSGSISNYTIYRAVTNKTEISPTDSSFQVVGYYEFPNPLLDSNTTFYDPDFSLVPSPLNEKKIWYKVEIADQGNNRANSTLVSTIFQSLKNISAIVVYDRDLTTYDDIPIRIVLTSNDINDDDMPDIDTIILNYSLEFLNGSTFNHVIIPNGEIQDIEYSYTINATNCYKIRFFVFINATDDFQGLNESYDYDSRIFYGDVFLISKPNIQFSDVDRPVGPKFLELDNFTISLLVLDSENYVKNVTLFYKIKTPLIQDPVWIEANFSFDSTNSMFSYTIDQSLLLGAEELEFYIIYFDTADNQYTILGEGDLQPYDIYPAFPTISLTVEQIIVIILGSCIVGAVIGSVYLYFKKRANDETRQEINLMHEKISKFVKATKKKSGKNKSLKDKNLELATQSLLPPNVSHFNFLYGTCFISMIGCTVAASILAWIFHSYEIATIVMIIAMFLALSVHVTWLYRDSKFSIRREHVNLLRMALNMIHPVIFLVITIYTLYIGGQISWIYYYIVQESGTSVPIVIPNIAVIPSIYIKIISLVFSSLIVFTFSVYWDIRKSIHNTSVYKKQNANISVILFTKEELLRRTYSRINMKIIFFLVLLGISLLPLSADGFLLVLPTALAFIGPAFLVFLGFFIVGFFQKSDLDTSGIILEPVKKCPSCNYVNVQSAQYCVNCRTNISPEQHFFDQTTKCPHCLSENPIESKYCKDCGSPLKEPVNPKK